MNTIIEQMLIRLNDLGVSLARQGNAHDLKQAEEIMDKVKELRDARRIGTANEGLMAAEIAVDKAKATMIRARDALNLQIEQMVDHQVALRKAWTDE